MIYFPSRSVRIATLFWVAVLLSFASSAYSADIGAGKIKAELCITCHGQGGNSTTPDIPSLSGQPAQAIATALFRFREGNRKNPVMSPLAAELSNADMNNLSAYFSSIKRISNHETQAANLAAGPELTSKYNCTQCHGPQLQGLQHIPRIAGQQYEYLTTQLRGFKAQIRSDMDGNMSSAAANVSDADIVILADYISGLKDQVDSK